MFVSENIYIYALGGGTLHYRNRYSSYFSDNFLSPFTSTKSGQIKIKIDCKDRTFGDSKPKLS